MIDDKTLDVIQFQFNDKIRDFIDIYRELKLEYSQLQVEFADLTEKHRELHNELLLATRSHGL